jgi:hypothetical protein
LRAAIIALYIVSASGLSLSASAPSGELKAQLLLPGRRQRDQFAAAGGPRRSLFFDEIDDERKHVVGDFVPSSATIFCRSGAPTYGRFTTQ